MADRLRRAYLESLALVRYLVAQSVADVHTRYYLTFNRHAPRYLNGSQI